MQKKINNKETFRGRKVSNLLTLRLIFVWKKPEKSMFCQFLPENRKGFMKSYENCKKGLAKERVVL